MKKIVLHIGTEKTATTSLQAFCFLNQTKLSTAGIWYPTGENLSYCHRSAHFPLAASLCEECPDFVTPQKYFDPDTLFAELLADFDARTENTLLLSAEHFSSRCSRPARIEKLAKLLQNRDVSILVYIRPQDEMLLSSYSTFLKSGGKKTLDEVSRQMWLRPKALYFNYLFLLRRWWQLFGRDKVSVRIFQPKQLIRGNIFQDFLSSLDIDLPEVALPQRHNEVMCKELADFLYLANQHFPTFRDNDRKGWELGQQFRAEIIPLFPSGAPLDYLLNPQLKADTKEYFKEYNRELCDIARPDLKGELFLGTIKAGQDDDIDTLKSRNSFNEEFVKWTIDQWRAGRPMHSKLKSVIF